MTIAVAPDRAGPRLGPAADATTWCADARDSGAEHLMLEVRADNAPAHRLYDRTGFDHLDDETRATTNPATSTRYVMRLDAEGRTHD